MSLRRGTYWAASGAHAGEGVDAGCMCGGGKLPGSCASKKRGAIGRTIKQDGVGSKKERLCTGGTARAGFRAHTGEKKGGCVLLSGVRGHGRAQKHYLGLSQ